MISFGKSTLKALFAAILAATVLLFIFALIAYNSHDPESMVGAFGMVVLFVASVVGGAVSRRGKGNIVNSLVFGVCFMLICFILALAFGGVEKLWQSLVLYTAGVAAAVLGGIMFGGTKARKPKSLKKYRKNRR